MAGYVTGYWRGVATEDNSQKRALKRYRQRLSERGMSRFEVLGLDTDRELIRSLARKLAENSPNSTHVRETIRGVLSEERPRTGGILAALRRSPLVGADLDLTRPVTDGRKTDL